MVTLQAIPILAIVPLISFWFGTGQTSRVVVCVIIALFPIIVNTLFGLQSADRGAHDLFTLHQANRVVRLRKLMFPAALPAIFAGLRISAGLSVIGAVVGDFFFGRGDVGIGNLLRRYASRLQGEELLARQREVLTERLEHYHEEESDDQDHAQRRQQHGDPVHRSSSGSPSV